MLPILWCVFHVFKSGGNMIAGRLVDRFGAKPMFLGGWVLYAGIYLGFALASAQWHVSLLFLGYAMFYACTEPAEKTLVAHLVGPDQRGLAYGWYNAAVGIGTLPASLLFGVHWRLGAPDGLRSRRHVGVAGRAQALGRQGRAARLSQNTLAMHRHLPPACRR